MNTRRIILVVFVLLVLVGVVNFAVNSIQTRSQLGMVGSKEAATQEEGVRRLMERGVLFDALQGSAQPPVRLAAIETLARMAQGGKNADAFKQLLQMLKDPDTESAEKKTHPVRDAARDAVAKVGIDYAEPLLDAAKDPDGNIRDQSREALKKIGAPLKEKMAARLGDSALRGPLGDILAGIGPETIPLIAPYLAPPLLKDDDTAAKLTLIETMGKFKVPEAATPILGFKDDKEPNVRRGVVTALANIGQPVGAPVLIEALGNLNTDASARAAAAGALGGIAAMSAQVAPSANAAMLKALSDDDLFVATAATAGLRRAGDVAAAQIAQALAHPDPAVRARAAEASGGLSSLALSARALKDPDAAVRAKAAEAMGDILMRTRGGASAALAPLLNALADTDGTVAQTAATALSRLGAAAAGPLTAKLAGSDDTVAYYASQALAVIGREAVDRLLPRVREGDPAARWSAITLGQIGDRRAADALSALTRSADPDTAYAAQTALAKVKPG